MISFFISDIDGKTLPRKMFEDIDYDLSPVLAAVATLLTALSLVVLLAAQPSGGAAAPGPRREAGSSRAPSRATA